MFPQGPPRRWQRQSVDLAVKVGIYRDTETISIPGRVTGLSEGGMSLYAGMPLNLGDLLEVEFEVPSRTVKAIVRNRDGFNFGLEFVETLHE